MASDIAKLSVQDPTVAFEAPTALKCGHCRDIRQSMRQTLACIHPCVATGVAVIRSERMATVVLADIVMLPCVLCMSDFVQPAHNSRHVCRHHARHSSKF
jgi:hypothetical protein